MAVALMKTARRTVLVRADMDALPVEEKLACLRRAKSENQNDAGVEVVIPLSGHDTHVASLLTTAKLAQLKDQWKAAR